MSRSGPRSDIRQLFETSVRLIARGEEAGDRGSVDTAIELLNRLAYQLPQNGSDLAVCLGLLIDAQCTLFDITSSSAALSDAIAYGERSLSLPLHPMPLIALARAYRAMFEKTAVTAYLQDSISAKERAVGLFTTSHPHHAALLSELGSDWRRLFDATSTGTHLDTSIDRQERAIAALPPGHSDLPHYRIKLARARHARYQHLGASEDLRTAIGLFEDALATGLDDENQLATCLTDLASASVAYFGCTAAPEDLEAALHYGERAAALSGTDRIDPILANVLGIAYKRRFELHSARADIDASIKYHRMAVAASVRDASPHAAYLSNLGLAHLSRFERTGDLADAGASIEQCARAVDCTPAGDPERMSRVAHLVAVYQLRASRTGARDDADSAIAHGERMLGTADAVDPDLVLLLSNLGAAYQQRYELTNDSADLQRKLDLAQRVLAMTGPADPRRAGRTWNVASGHAHRFASTRNLEDLRRAIDLGEQAVAGLPPRHPDTGVFLGNLCAFLRVFYDESLDQQRADLDRAVEYGEQAVSILPAKDARRSSALGDLGAAYQTRFEHYRDPADARAAIDRCEQAAALPSGDRRRAGALSNLAEAYRLALNSRIRTVDPKTLARLVESTADLGAASAWERVRATRAVGSLLMTAGESIAGARMLRAAVAALGEVTSPSLTLEDQLRGIRAEQGLVSQAVAAQLTVGEKELAVRLAEQGRGVVLLGKLGTRSDPSRLTDASPALAAELIDGRQLPALADVQRACADGSVVIVNISDRSDALILNNGGITAVSLPGASWQDVRWNTESLLQATDARFPMDVMERRSRVSDVMSWLWYHVTGPVLDALGHDGRHGSGGFPRIWWVPTGPMSLLPLHAAGIPDGPSALDRVVSSYAPTIRGLLRSRTRAAAGERRQLTVAVPRASGYPDLAQTATEALDPAVTPTEGSTLLTDRATARNVLTALEGATWAHFACHAVSDHKNPLEGGMALKDGTLTVSQISRLRLGPKGLAYLSACETARPSLDHLDEAIHLGSAFQLIGYRHVIGTLWQAGDETAARVARGFYRSLPDGTSIDRAAHALHGTVRALRDERPDRPDLWAPFIHIGP